MKKCLCCETELTDENVQEPDDDFCEGCMDVLSPVEKLCCEQWAWEKWKKKHGVGSGDKIILRSGKITVVHKNDDIGAAELEENWERHRPDEDDEEFWGQPEELDEEQEDVKKVL